MLIPQALHHLSASQRQIAQKKTMSSERINVGIIGYGQSAKTYHIPFINARPELKLSALTQRTPRPGLDAKKDFTGAVVYHSVQEIVQDPSVHVVVITTPPDAHFALAKEALLAGKHVVVEKPFTPTSSEAKQLTEIANERSLRLTVFQNRRFDADFVTLLQLIKSGSLGRVVEFASHFDSYRPEYPTTHPWKNKPMPGGGAIYDLGTHLIDQIYQLFGMPEKITGFLGSQRAQNPNGYEESFTVLLQYPGGMLATAKASAVSPEDKQLRFWVRGDTGSYKKFHRDVQEEQLKAGKGPADKGFGQEPSDHHGVLSKYEEGRIISEVYPTADPAPTYEEFYRQIAASIATGQDVPVSPGESCQVMKLVELAITSARKEETLRVE